MGTEKIKRCVIVTAGPMGDYEPLKAIVDKNSDYIISVDGGCDHLNGLGLHANLEIGDLDSAKNLPDGVKILKFNEEKDETDTMLAVMHGFELGYNSFLILGGLRGRLDHTFANLTTLLYISRRKAVAKIVDSENEAFVVENGEITLEARYDYYISVFAFGGNAEGVTEKGFKYSLSDYTINAGCPIGVSNQFKEKKGTISVKKGAILIILSKKCN